MLGVIETPPIDSMSLASSVSPISSNSAARARAEARRALIGFEEGLLASSSSSITSSSSSSNSIPSSSSSCATTEAALPLFAFASSRFLSSSSAFRRFLSSISARILSLYGKRFGIPGSFLIRDRHSGLFLASFLCLRPLAAPAFWILCRRRTGVRLDFGSVVLLVPFDSFKTRRHTSRFVGHCDIQEMQCSTNQVVISVLTLIVRTTLEDLGLCYLGNFRDNGRAHLHALPAFVFILQLSISICSII